MTEPHHEPSYYEIALTNRQVVVAFVVLLVCLLAAFFSGVWIGRGSAERNAGEEQVARAAPPPEPTEGRNLEELKFFSDETGSKRRGKGRGEAAEAPAPATAPSPAPSAAPPPSPAGGAAEEGSAAAPPPPQTVRHTPPPAAEPEESAQAPVPPPPSRRGTSAPRPADRAASGTAASGVADSGAVVRSRRLPEETASAGSDVAAGGAAADQGGGGSTVIQVFASADSNEAKKVRDRLAHGGEPAFVSPLTVDGRTMYRVRVGPFPSRARAQKEADRVRRAYKLDTWLTE